MNKLLICSHGSLSKGLFSSLNIIMGDVENVDYLTFYENGEGAAQLEKIENYFKENKEYQLIVLTDVFGGSVNQEVIKKAKDYDNIRIVSGVNFPLLLELAIRLHTEITDEELKNIIEQSKSQMLMVETKLETEFKDDFDVIVIQECAPVTYDENGNPTMNWELKPYADNGEEAGE